jgi:hypothetical protein
MAKRTKKGCFGKPGSEKAKKIAREKHSRAISADKPRPNRRQTSR